MSVPKGFNVKVNDYLRRHKGLGHAEFRVAAETIQLDYGFAKEGLFWESAQSVGDRLGVDREWVKRTWGKMEFLGWLTDTGERKGRAVVWKINHDRLWNEAIAEPVRIQVADSIARIAEPVAPIAEPVRTNLPNESSKRILSDRVAESASVSSMNGREEQSSPRSAKEIPRQGIASPRAPAPLNVPRPKSSPLPVCKYCKRETLACYMSTDWRGHLTGICQQCDAGY